MVVLREVENANAVAALAGHLGHERAGFAFAEDEEQHGKLLQITDDRLQRRADSSQITADSWWGRIGAEGICGFPAASPKTSAGPSAPSAVLRLLIMPA